MSTIYLPKMDNKIDSEGRHAPMINLKMVYFFELDQDSFRQ